MRLRIISGKYKRRKLLSPPAGAITRPFPDMVKEAMF
ncbi:MAG: RsmD family RNA methyltransferase, partial [Phycisphaerales bacterium]